MRKKYIDEKHKTNYKKYIEKDNTADGDFYTKALFYILSSLDQFRRNITLIYDFDKKGVKKSVFEKITLSDSELGLLELAFHLYNSKNEFNLNTAFSNFESERLFIALNGIQIRYNQHLLYNYF